MQSPAGRDARPAEPPSQFFRAVALSRASHAAATAASAATAGHSLPCNETTIRPVSSARRLTRSARRNQLEAAAHACPPFTPALHDHAPPALPTRRATSGAATFARRRSLRPFHWQLSGHLPDPPLIDQVGAPP